jgi:hypothetical protein
MLREIKETTPNGLLGTGYDDQMLANLLMVTRTQDEIKDFDTAAEWVGMPDFEGVNQDDRLQIIVYFEDEVARGKFMSQVKDTIPSFSPTKKSPRAWYEWYPHTGNEDPSSVKFVSEDTE